MAEDEHLRQCPLCLTGEIEDLDHLMRCPALHRDLVAMGTVVKGCLIKFGLGTPVSASEGERIRDHWFFQALKDLQPTEGSSTIDSEDIRRLLDSWIHSNGVFRTYNSFIQAAKERVRLHLASYNEYWLSFPKSLSSLLSEVFSLSVEGITNAIRRSEVFDEWWSNDEIDKMFGAKGNFLKQELCWKKYFVDLSTVVGVVTWVLKFLIRLREMSQHRLPPDFYWPCQDPIQTG